MTNTIHNHEYDHSRQQGCCCHDKHTSTVFTDPVCGMSTEDETAFTEYEYKGTTYHFCSDHCLAKFKENPGAYGAGETTGCCHSDHAEKTDLSKGCCHGN